MWMATSQLKMGLEYMLLGSHYNCCIYTIHGYSYTVMKELFSLSPVHKGVSLSCHIVLFSIRWRSVCQAKITLRKYQ